MLSLGSRDRGFSSCSNRRDIVGMKDVVELEEGEACSYQQEDYDDDPTIDPDIALSYIGEKLQNVLGHFQKDFEGLVSADSLGPKNGEYGTFLPAYRRSPIAHHKSSPRVQNRHTPQPSSTLPTEGHNRNSLATANVAQVVKRGSTSAHPATSTASNPLPQNEPCVQIPKAQSIQQEFTPKPENRDQRTLKVRIKVGSSDNSTVKKNTAIYSGLGLGDSPSPSFDDSQKESQGLSPTQIIQMMTSFTPFGGCVSPLTDNLLHISEKPGILPYNPVRPSSKVNQRLPYLVKDNKALPGENTIASEDSRQQNKGESDRQVRLDFPLKESDVDVDVVSCEELISNALKLPLLSDSYGNKKEGIYSNAKSLTQKPNGIVKSEGNMRHTNEKMSHANNSIKLSGKEMSSSGGRKKTKKGRVRDSATGKLVVESAKDGAQSPRDGKILDTKWPSFKSEGENFPLEKDAKKMKDTYSDFFGNLSDHEDETMKSPAMLFKERLKTSEVVPKAELPYENISKEKTKPIQARGDPTSEVEKATLGYENISREKMRSVQEMKNSTKSRRKVSSITPMSGPSNNVVVSENSQPISDQADVWALCDSCKTWRLLPPGTKEDELPDEWHCSLQTWLPNMNRCGITMEEGVAAVKARYNLLTEIPNSLDVPLDKLGPDTVGAGILLPIVPSDGKLKKTLKSPSRGSLNGPSSSSKMKQQSSKVRTSTKFKDSPLTNAQQTKSTDMSLETNQRKISKQLQPDCHSDGGNFKSPKIKGRRESEPEVPRTSKRSKTRGSQSGDSNRATSLVQGNEMFDVSSGNGVLADSAGKDPMFDVSFGNLKTESGGKRSKQQPNVSGTIAPKKRKRDSFKNPINSTPSSGKGMDESEQVRNKRHRMSKSEAKVASTSKGNGKADRKSRSNSQHITDHNEPSLRKDPSSANVATTSSSSKATISLKVKYKFQELKNSPVESVSSSPLRSSISEKIASGCKVKLEKDEAEARKGSFSKCVNERSEGEGKLDATSSRDKNQICKVKLEKGEVKMSESYVNMPDNVEICEEREKEGTIRVRDNFDCNVPEPSIPECKGQMGNNEKSGSKMLDSEKPEPLKSVSIKGESQCLPPFDEKKNEISNATQLPRIPNGNKINIKEDPSALKRDSLSLAASSAMKEAKSLKHLADRLKNADSMDSLGLYFDAGLKFLYAASILESGKTEKPGDIVQAMQIYSDTAKLCRFVAYEYEKSKDMATAALAYKCVEVAYLRVVYSSHNIASRDRSELQTVLQMVPPGESPSSSASDIDNLNNTAIGDKAAQARSVDSPLPAGNLVIAARNRPNFSRLLSFAQDVNSAMEASRKSHIAFGAASANMGHRDTMDSIASIKRALDFNFHDVEGLLRLVRLAKEATGQAGDVRNVFHNDTLKKFEREGLSAPYLSSSNLGRSDKIDYTSVVVQKELED